MEMEMLLCGGSYWWAGRDGHGGKDNRLCRLLPVATASSHCITCGDSSLPGTGPPSTFFTQSGVVFVQSLSLV